MTILQHNYKNVIISQTSDNTSIGNYEVPKGYVNLTEMCKTNPKKKLSDYLSLASTKEYILELENDMGIPASSLIIEVEGYGHVQGTWGHTEIAIDLARWVSTPFRVWANRVLVKVINGEFKALTEDAEQALKKLNELWDLIRQHGKATRNDLTYSIKQYLLRHPDKSDDYKRWIYANATNAMYHAVFGMTAQQLEELLTCGRNKLRDNLDSKCLDRIDRVEAAICDLINDQDLEPMTAVASYIKFMRVLPMFPNRKLERCDLN